VPLIEQELSTLPEHLGLSPDFSGVRFTRSLVLYVCFELPEFISSIATGRGIVTLGFEDVKGVIRIRISKKNRQHNVQKKKYKRTNNDLQNIRIKLKIG
jgi:hypothetical protein